MSVRVSSVTKRLRRLWRHYGTGKCIQSVHERLRGVLPIDLRRIELRGTVKLLRLQLFMYQLRVHLRDWTLMRATTGTIDGSKKLVLIDIHTSSGIVHRRTMKSLACSCADLEWIMIATWYQLLKRWTGMKASCTRRRGRIHRRVQDADVSKVSRSHRWLHRRWWWILNTTRTSTDHGSSSSNDWGQLLRFASNRF